MTRLHGISPNLSAFLDMLAVSEGTSTAKRTQDDGYDIIVGGERFDSYSDHPRVLVPLPKLGIKSSAAGRYQLLARYYDAYSKQLGLPDFEPENQDRIAIQQIKERGALQMIDLGHFNDAVARVKNIWASLPGAGYGQHENSLQKLRAAYIAAGGVVA